MKKILCLMLAVLMMLMIGLNAVNSYAEDGDPDGENCVLIINDEGELVEICGDGTNVGGDPGCTYNCW